MKKETTYAIITIAVVAFIIWIVWYFTKKPPVSVATSTSAQRVNNNSGYQPSAPIYQPVYTTPIVYIIRQYGKTYFKCQEYYFTTNTNTYNGSVTAIYVKEIGGLRQLIQGSGEYKTALTQINECQGASITPVVSNETITMAPPSNTVQASINLKQI